MRKFFVLSLLALFCVSCAKTKKAPALAPPEPPPAPLTPMDLSVFDENEAGCVWNRIHFPGAEVKTIAQFPSTCAGADVVWSADLMRALVSFNPKHVSGSSIGGAKNDAPPKAQIGPLQAFEVDIATGNQTPLPPTKKLRGELELFGITPQGIVALSLESSDKLGKALAKEINKKKKTFQLSGGGEKISIELPKEPAEGTYAVAHAWLLKDGTWKRLESKFTTTGWDHGLGVNGLDTYHQFGPRAQMLLKVHSLPNAEELKEVGPLSAWTPQTDDERMRWEKQSTPHGELFAWMTGVEVDYMTGLLLYQPKGKEISPLPGLGFTKEELVALLIRGTWLLVGTKDIGAWPRVYDLRKGELAWSSDSARAVVFWPE